MQVLILSDTHGFLDEAVLRHAREADETWHAGDIGNVQVADVLADAGPLRAVYGNIDGMPLRQRFPGQLRFTAEGLDVFMTHIGGYPGKYDRGIGPLLKRNPPGLFISGHSHIVKVMRDPALGQMIHINPGAAGREGFHRVRTVVKIQVMKGRVSDVRVVELGNR